MTSLLAVVAALLKAFFGWAVAANKPTALDAETDKEIADDLNSQISDLPPLPDDAS